MEVKTKIYKLTINETKNAIFSNKLYFLQNIFLISIVVYNFFWVFNIPFSNIISFFLLITSVSFMLSLFLYLDSDSFIAFALRISLNYRTLNTLLSFCISFFLAFICYYTRYFRLVHLAILNLCSLNGFPRFTLSLQV